jgi:hydrogenase maturation protease
MILVAGVGNIFLGDDAFGCEVARRLLMQPVPEHVRIVDFGIRGLDLAYALLDGYDATLIIDAMPRGGVAGSVYVLEPDLTELSGDLAAVEAHAMDPVRVLAVARSMGAELCNIRIVGCEPESFGPSDEGRMGLSPPVAAAVEKAVEVVNSLIQEALVRT